MGKVRTKKTSYRSTPLAAQLEHDKSDAGLYKNRDRTGKLAQTGPNVDMNDNDYIESKLSKRILLQAKKQIEEEDALEQGHVEEQDFQDTASTTSKSSKKNKKRHELGGIRFFDDEDFEADTDTVASETESQYLADIETVASEDERALQMFMNPNVPARRLLSDIIMQKIHDYENPAPEAAAEKPRLSREVLEVYSKTGEVMHTLTCGRLPKAFSILPKLKNWEEVLYVTRPDAWSPHATYHATITFTASPNAQMAQRFLNTVLLPKCRDTIAETKKLPFAMHRALKKSLHIKPGAWFKGIFLPLCESGDCTLREAHVIGYILKQCMVPPLHLSVALLKLAEMEYQGAISTMMLVLLEKRHALPWKVIDGVAAHFFSFKNEERTMPIHWYRAFLMFAQRYKNSLTAGQRSALIKVAKKHKKYQFSDEIIREIQSAVPERDTDKMEDTK